MVEGAQGDTCNIIAVAMREKNLTIEDALEFSLLELPTERHMLFLDCQAKLPSYDPDVDQQIKSYIKILDDWFRAEFECWNLESQPYLGDQVTATLETKALPFLSRIVNPKSNSAV